MIIQFSHNGEQLNISRRSAKHGIAYKFDIGSDVNGVRFWNNEPSHKRKFIKNRGWYLQNINNTHFNPTPIEEDLYFWGEWEPQSRFHLTGNEFKYKTLPHAIHFPFFANRGIGGHNTDPFVFGENFYYTNCKQKLARQGLMMLSLPNNSIILFGSEINRTHFVMDTLFVVGNSETVANYRTHPSLYPNILRQATIDLHAGLPDWMRLYKGKMYDLVNQYNEPDNRYTFCLFPCKIGQEGADGFERPIIDVRRFHLKTVGAGTVLMQVNYNSDFDFWHDIVAELIAQGYSLGIKTVMPQINEEINLPEYNEPMNRCDNE